MKSRRSARWLGACALLVCVVVGAIGLGAGTVSSTRSPLERYGREGIGELVATARACQTFVAQYDGLSQVRVMLDDLGRENSWPFQFTLRSIPDADGVSDALEVPGASEAPDASKVPDADGDIVRLTHDASDVKLGQLHLFEFAPVRDSDGGAYVFCLEAPQAPLDNSITAIGMLDDWYPDGKAVFHDMWGERAGVQDLDFYLGYRLSPGDKLRVLSERLAAGKPFLFGRRWFYVLLGAIYLAALWTLLVKSIPLSGGKAT